MKRGDVYDYETDKLIRKGTDTKESSELTGGIVFLYILGGIVKVLGIVFLGVGVFMYYVFKALTR